MAGAARHSPPTSPLTTHSPTPKITIEPPGCNPGCSRLQSYVLQAATLCTLGAEGVPLLRLEEPAGLRWPLQGVGGEAGAASDAVVLRGGELRPGGEEERVLR